MIFRSRTQAAEAERLLVDGVLVLKGDMAIRGSGVVHGRIEGTLNAENPVTLAEDADVRGGVKAGDLHVKGRLEGWVRAQGRVVLAASAEMTGPLRAGALEIQPGARYRGVVTVVPEGT